MYPLEVNGRLHTSAQHLHCPQLSCHVLLRNQSRCQIPAHTRIRNRTCGQIPPMDLVFPLAACILGWPLAAGLALFEGAVKVASLLQFRPLGAWGCAQSQQGTTLEYVWLCCEAFNRWINVHDAHWNDMVLHEGSCCLTLTGVYTYKTSSTLPSCTRLSFQTLISVLNLEQISKFMSSAPTLESRQPIAKL